MKSVIGAYCDERDLVRPHRVGARGRRYGGYGSRTGQAGARCHAGGALSGGQREAGGIEVERVSVAVKSALSPFAALGAERLVDPGEIEIKGRLGATSVMKKVAIAEGEEKAVVLRFEDVPRAKPKAVKAGEAMGDATAEPSEEASPLRLPGWIGVGAGVAAAVMGMGLLAAASGEQDERDAVASGGVQGTPRRCTEEQTREMRSLEDKRSTANTLSAVAFTFGGVF